MKSIRMLKRVGVVFLMGLWGQSCTESGSGSVGAHDAKTAVGKSTVASSTALSSWSDQPRSELLNWLQAITDSTSASFIPVRDRIAVFDNDGTLWPEQPVPTQLVFALDHLRKLAAENPALLKNPVIAGALQGDHSALKKAGLKGLFDIINASHNGQTETQFNQAVAAWIDTAQDPRFKRRYKEVIYQPMLELVDCLKRHQFTVFIVSGGGADFMRVWSEEVYGIPSHQVIGSYGEARYEVVNGKPVITKTNGNVYVDDKAGKPVAIHRFIGKVPVFCGGNSDGDMAMMQYTQGSKYQSKIVLLHHTDSLREYAYDRKTLSGHLEEALVEAREKNWIVVDMKKDFKTIFSFQ